MKKIRKITKFKGLVGENDELLNEYKSSLQEFDEKNNCTKEVEFTTEGEIETASGYKFDEKNNLIEEIHYFEGGEVGEVVKYKLNDEGKPVEITTNYADGSLSVKKASRFENMVSVKSFDEDEELEGEDLVKYNGDGKIIEEIRYDEDKSIVNHSLYTYNADQKIQSKTVYGENEEFLEKAVFEYDDKGNLIRETHLNRKDLPMDQIIYSYDDSDELIEWYNNQYLLQSKYDEDGRLIYEETRNRGNNIVESFSEYKYNGDGLLIESRDFKLGQQYQLQPNVYTRGKLTFVVTRHELDFFE